MIRTSIVVPWTALAVVLAVHAFRDSNECTCGDEDHGAELAVRAETTPGPAVRHASEGRDERLRESLEPAVPVTPEDAGEVVDSGEDEEVDATGLTRSEKIRKVVQSYERFETTRDDSREGIRAMAEYWFAIHSAVTVLQAEGEGQYSFDVDDESQRGFRLEPPSESAVQVAADNAKYEISLDRFPAVAFALERRALAEDPDLVLHPLSEQEQQIYAQAKGQALAALNVDPAEGR